MRYLFFALSLCWLSSYAQTDRYKLTTKDTLVTCTVDGRSRVVGPFSDLHSADFEKLAEAVFAASPFLKDPYTLIRSNEATTLRIGRHSYDELEYHTFLLYNLDSVMNYNVKAKTRFGLMAILAHEIGHHVLHHFMKLPEATLAHQELQADFFAGWILAKLNVPEADAVKGLVMSFTSTSIYPAEKDRLGAIKLGYTLFANKGMSALTQLENGSIPQDVWLKKWARKLSLSPDHNLLTASTISTPSLELTHTGILVYTKQGTSYALARAIPSKDARYAYLLFDNQFTYWWIKKDGALVTANEEKVLAQVNLEGMRRGE